MTNLVSVPGRNISSSQCGIRLNMENPRIRYRPSSDFTWMSLITSGVKMLLRPRTARLPSSAVLIRCSLPVLAGGVAAGVGRRPRRLQDELALGRLEVVVVPELLAADELAERGLRTHPVDPQLALEQFVVFRGELRLDAVNPEGGDLAADVDRAVIHGVAEPAAHVPADNLPPALQHESRHGPRVAAHDDRAALLVDAGACPHVAPDHQVAAAQRGTGQRACV